MKFDIIIASYPFGHEQTYQRLLNDFQSQAKFIVHEGNIYQQSSAKNVLSSTVPHPTDQNVVFYHQEFNLEVYKYHPPKNIEIIRSFVNGLPRRDLYFMYRNYLPEFTFEAYGSGNDMDGTISSEEEIARLMSESMFGWHVKPRGDGFGHVIHNWYACGRPVITCRSDYADKLAAPFLIDGETCIDLEQGGIEDNLKKIRFWAEPENHKKMCENAYKKFKEVVNFEAEAEQVKVFLENLQ